MPTHSRTPDLFWACRGGGGGTFGVATAYQLRLIPLTNVLIFNIRSGPLSLARAAAIMKAWQAWAPQAPRTINSNLVITRHSSGLIDVRCAGQSVGTSQELQRELKFLTSAAPLSMSYWKAVNYFAGSDGWTYTSAPMKGKSDYATSPLSDAGLSTLMNEINRHGSVYVICNSYGGAIASTAPDATAFAHRSALYCIQYGSSWTSASDTPHRLSDMQALYAAMRPYVSGGAYVNYCDLDLTDWQDAYSGANLPAQTNQIRVRSKQRVHACAERSTRLISQGEIGVADGERQHGVRHLRSPRPYRDGPAYPVCSAS